MNEIVFQWRHETFRMDSLIDSDDLAGMPMSFEIESDGLIGQGGNAVVYRCRDVDSGEDYAIKIQMAAGDNREKRFRREIHLLQKSNHAQLMSCVSSGIIMLRKKKEAKIPHEFVIMPLAEQNLNDLVQHQDEGNLFPFEVLAGQFRGLSEALAVLHESAIHRDIKPENILIRGDMWMLADFGLCKFLASEEHDVDITLDNEKVGPKYWMSPESMNRMIGNNDEITKASDVFQLASVFWFATTKRHPTGIVKASDWRGPHEIFEVLESALSHDPHSRPQDGCEFHERIEKAIF